MVTAPTSTLLLAATAAAVSYLLLRHHRRRSAWLSRLIEISARESALPGLPTGSFLVRHVDAREIAAAFRKSMQAAGVKGSAARPKASKGQKRKNPRGRPKTRKAKKPAPATVVEEEEEGEDPEAPEDGDDDEEDFSNDEQSEG